MPQRPIAAASLWAGFALSLPLAPAAGLHRLQDTGELRGVVVDVKTNEPLGGVEVSFVQIDFSARTDSLGRYAITNIPPGRYTLLVKSEGFKPAVAARHMLFAGSVNSLDFALERVTDPPEKPPAEEVPDSWAEVLPATALRANTNLIVALRASITGFRLQQVTTAPVTGAGRRAPPRAATEGAFVWVVDGRAVSRNRAAGINTSDVTCVEIRRGAEAAQRFARAIPANRGGEVFDGVVLVWTRGSRAPMPEACSPPE